MTMDAPKNVLVTGGFGFIGAAMVRRLLAAGHQVTVLAKAGTNPARLSDVLDRITVMEDDLHNAPALSDRLRTLAPNGVFHFAASNIQTGVTAGNRELLDTNVLGTVNLIDALSEVNYDFFINVGTFLEYGMKGRPVKEEDRAEPPNLYSISKLAGTLYGQAVAKSGGKPIVTLRLMTPYGPGMQEKRLVREVLERAMAGEPLSLTAPSVSRDFIYIDDFLSLCLEAAMKARTLKGELFNAGTGIATTLETLASETIALTNSKSEVAWGSFKDVAYDSDIWCADMTKTFAAFSWRPAVTLTEGLEHTYRWLKAV